MEVESIVKREITFDDLKSLIPSSDPGRHKGQNGKIGVIGGSFEYTGAPYYGAAAALRGGGDLSHIFCTDRAAVPIKSYSPEIIVHPYLLSEDELQRSVNFDEVQRCVKSVTKWYDPLHAVVIGSGLGRDNAVSLCLEDLYSNLKDLVTVCDGDFFWFLLEKNKESLAERINKRSKVTVLTPNKVEFKRLWDFVKGADDQTSEEDIKKEKAKLESVKANVIEISTDNPIVRDQVTIANKLNNVTILYKGEFDIITNGKEAYLVMKRGCRKRCGGQGDILAGLTSLYCCWDFQRQKGKEVSIDIEKISLVKGCILASYITRDAASRAYQKEKIGLTSPGVLDEVAAAINDFIEKGL